MELQFEQDTIRYLCRTAWGEKPLEETGEIRLPEQEKMPDVILGAWGQPLLMEKEWAGDTVTLSGGVNVWVLLRNKEESEVQCVEGWVPFRQTWELQDSRQDGKLCVQCALRGVDARMTGAGKLIVTVQLSIGLQALEPCAAEQYDRGQLPEDVYTLEDSISVTAPVEAGEKRTSLEEDMILPPGKPDVDRVLFYKCVPEVFDRKIMGDKLVFRGAIKLHLVYTGKDGTVCACDGEFPVSQYIQLDREYGSAAMADVLPVMTSAEALSTGEGRIAVKFAALWQYLIHDGLQVSCVLDAYSNNRSLEAQMYTLRLPDMLQKEDDQQSAECAFAVEASQVVDHEVMASCWAYNEKTGCLESDGMARILYYDQEGMLQGAASGWSASSQMPCEGCTPIAFRARSISQEAEQGSDRVALQVTLPYSAYAMGERVVNGVSALDVSDEPRKKDTRPSLILRRANGDTLWRLAKVCGSSPTAIMEANDLKTELADNRMLLIPVE